MDKKQLILWLAGIVARGVAWILAAKLGMEASEASSTGTAVGEALGALAIASVSIWYSVRDRKKILATPPPK